MDRNKKNCYVYAHMRNDTGEIFYVGIGSQKNYKRAFSLVGRNRLWKRIANKHGYTVGILYNGLSWNESCEKEKELISRYGRINIGTGTLCNMTDGGEGAKGVIRDAEVRENMAAAKRGKKQSDETIAKRVANNTGKKRTPEQREKISNALRGCAKTKEHRENISKAKRGVKLNPDKIDGILKGLKKAVQASKLSNSKLILNTETGIYYDNMSLAAESVGKTRYWLGNRLRGRVKQYCKFIYA